MVKTMAGESRISREVAVGADLRSVEEATRQAEAFVASLALDEGTSRRIRLLTEETLEMVKALVGAFDGRMWLDAGPADLRIHLAGTASVNLAREKELLSLSTEGVNRSVRGVTARLSQFIRHHREYIDRLTHSAPGEEEGDDYLYLREMDRGGDDVEWSMSEYRRILSEGGSATERRKAARDELEKSIVANLADELRVGVKGDQIRITVLRRL